MDDDSCAVCMEPLSSDHVHTLAGCGHAFHSNCIIEWMQRGNVNCPMCRTDAHHREFVSPLALIDRAKYIRRTWGRRVHKPPELERILRSLRAAESAEAAVRREYREYTRAHRDVILRARTLRRQMQRASFRTGQRERVLGLFQAPGLTLPALSVYGGMF